MTIADSPLIIWAMILSISMLDSNLGFQLISSKHCHVSAHLLYVPLVDHGAPLGLDLGSVDVDVSAPLELGLDSLLLCGS